MNLAIILSENTKNSVAYGRKSSRLAGFDLAPMIEESFSFFKTNFKSVSRINQVSEARGTPADLVVLVDEFVVAKRTFKMDAELVFMDLNGKEIDRVKTQSEKGFSFSPRKVIQGVMDNVARALEQGMRSSSKLAAYAASRGKGPSIAAARPTVKILGPTYKERASANSFALVVGIESYSNIPDALFAERDAQAMVAHLEALGVPRRNIIHLAGSKATLTGLKKYLQAWLPKNVKPSSRVFFFSRVTERRTSTRATPTSSRGTATRVLSPRPATRSRIYTGI